MRNLIGSSLKKKKREKNKYVGNMLLKHMKKKFIEIIKLLHRSQKKYFVSGKKK